MHEVLSTPRSPWQRAYIERVIGSIRRECLDHVIVFHENWLRRTFASYFDYYHRSRTHLSLAKDSPEPRSIQPAGDGISRGSAAGRWAAPPLRTTGRLKKHESTMPRATSARPVEVCFGTAPPAHACLGESRSPESSRSANYLSFAVRPEMTSAIGSTEFSLGTVGLLRLLRPTALARRSWTVLQKRTYADTPVTPPSTGQKELRTAQTSGQLANFRTVPGGPVLWLSQVTGVPE